MCNSQINVKPVVLAWREPNKFNDGQWDLKFNCPGCNSEVSHTTTQAPGTVDGFRSSHCRTRGCEFGNYFLKEVVV